MRLSLGLWVVLAIVGLFEALTSSAFFFGFFTLGLFLIFYDLRTKRESKPAPPSVTIASSTHVCQNCGMILEAGAAFCPRCGGRVKKE